MGSNGDHDEAIRAACARASAICAPEVGKTSFLKAYLERALVGSFGEGAAGGRATARELRFVADWEPQPRHVDFLARLRDEANWTMLAELKVDDIDQTLWDLYKLLGVRKADPRIQGTYLIVASPPRKWQRLECAELFEPSEDARTWDSSSLFERWNNAWSYLLKGGSARPQQVPTSVETRFLWAGPVASFPEYELRAISVRPASDEHLRFKDGWPDTSS